MSVLLYPSESIARRWTGALRARLRRQPLEVFLRTRHLKVTYADATRDSDNVARAVIYVIEAGAQAYHRIRQESFNEAQQSLLAQTACAGCYGLARLIQEEAVWRVAAMISTAQLLSPMLGMNAAAQRATAAVREFYDDSNGYPRIPESYGISEQTSKIIRTNDDRHIEAASWAIGRRLDARRAEMPRLALAAI